MKRKPRIAVSACIMHPDAERTLYNGRMLSYIEQSMFDWLVAGGALPYMVAPIGRRPSDTTYLDLLEPFDALVLEGGADVSPTSYGEQPRDPAWAGDRFRDDFEIGLVKAAMRMNKPVLGVCRGHQLLNVALGGTLYQDIETDVPAALQHRNAELYERNKHEVEFAPDGELHRMYGVHRAMINSVHHQAIKDVAPGLEVLARSASDDVIEAVKLRTETSDDPWVMGVQWHPEFQSPDDDELLSTQPILDALFHAIQKRAE